MSQKGKKDNDETKQNEVVRSDKKEKVVFKKLTDKRKEKVQEITMDLVLKKLQKTLQYIVYMKASSFALQRLLNYLAKNKQFPESYLVLLIKKIADWREYIMWLESIVQYIKLFAENDKNLRYFAKHQMKFVIDISKNIRLVLRSVELALSFVTVTKFVAGGAFRLTAKTLTLKGIVLSSALLYFLHTQLQSFYPLLEQYTNELVSFVKTVITDNIEILLEDLEENNPQLYRLVKAKIAEFEKWSTILPVLVSYSMGEITKSIKRSVKPYYYTYVLPNLIPVIQVAFKGYYKGKKAMKKFYLLDPMTLLSQDNNFAQEFLQSVLSYFSSLTGSKPIKSKL